MAVGHFTTGAEPGFDARSLYLAWQVVGGLLLGLACPRSVAWSWLLFLGVLLLGRLVKARL